MKVDSADRLQPRTVVVSVRNTFLHYECEAGDSFAADVNDEPVVCRTATAPPLGRGRDKETGTVLASLLGKSMPVPAGSEVDSRQLDRTGALYESVTGNEMVGSLERSRWTTIMLRNLPNSYTRRDLVDLLISQGFAGRFDFLYLPIDFKTHAALGYAFVNMLAPTDAEELSRSLVGFTGWSVPCGKVCRVSWSQPLQGLEAHIARYRNSPLMHEAVPDQYRPMLLCGGVPVPLPPPTKTIKPPRKGTQRMLV